ncbi:MAG TPA: oligosaccharide flippase family protein [Candidatus Kapabacteria bacterium]|nr:oligosaccharide flippase family protein [Candidatus Kapabacteria bacterium]
MSTVPLAQRLSKVAAGGFLYSLLGNGMIYIGQIIIARSLDRIDYATFSVVVALVSLSAMFADLGWTPLLVKRFAQAEADHVTTDQRGVLLGTSLLIKFVLSVAAAILGIVVASVIYGAETGVLVMVGTATFFISSRVLVFRAVLESFVRAEGALDKVLRLGALDACAFAFLLFAWSSFDLTLTSAVAIYSLCHLPGFVLLLHYMNQVISKHEIRLSYDRSVAKDLFRTALPLTIGMCLLTVHNMADTLILEALSTPYQVSAYAASFRLMAGLAFLPAVVAGVVMPEFVKLLHRGEHDRATKLTALSLQSLLTLAVFIALLLSALAPIVVDVLLGGRYADAWLLVVIFGWMFLPVAFASFIIELGIAAGRQRMFGYYTAILAAVTVVGDLIVAAPYGAVGVTLVKFLAIAIGCVVLVLQSMKSGALKDVLKSIKWRKNVLSLLLPLSVLGLMSYVGVASVIAGVVTATLFAGWSLWSGLVDLDRIASLLKGITTR